MSGPEVIYAVRRADGEPMLGAYDYLTTSGPEDWAPAEGDEYDAVEYEMLRMTVEVVARRTLPECSDPGCTAPAEFWGLCEPHAREDDPSYFERRGGAA